MTIFTHEGHLTTHTKSATLEVKYDYNQLKFKATHQCPKLQTKEVQEGDYMNAINVTEIITVSNLSNQIKSINKVEKYCCNFSITISNMYYIGYSFYSYKVSVLGIEV